MARGAGKTITIAVAKLPWLKNAAALAQSGFVTGASGRNWKSYDTSITLPADTPEWRRQLLCDPQTSGGLLVACARHRADALLETIIAAGYPAARIVGNVTDGKPRVVIEE
jgi:selenide, water dikinase